MPAERKAPSWARGILSDHRVHLPAADEEAVREQILHGLICRTSGAHKCSGEQHMGKGDVKGGGLQRARVYGLVVDS